MLEVLMGCPTLGSSVEFQLEMPKSIRTGAEGEQKQNQIQNMHVELPTNFTVFTLIMQL